VVYAEIGPSSGEGIHCQTVLRFQDDKIEYAEIKSPIREPAQSAPNPSQTPGMHKVHIAIIILYYIL
jgi:hypothetical protein